MYRSVLCYAIYDGHGMCTSLLSDGKAVAVHYEVNVAKMGLY